MEHYRKHGTVLTPSMLRRIRKREIGAVDSTRVVLVDGEVVRDRVDIDFTTGGNPSRYRYVPNGEVWVERTTPSDLAPNIVHEIVEAKLMRKGLSYDKAHDRASRVEGGMRREIASGKLRVRDSRDAVRAANWFLNPRNRPLGKGTQP